MSRLIGVNPRGGSQSVTLDNSVDSAGRVETATNIPLGEYVLDNDERPDYFNNETNGTGSITYDSSINSKSMDVSADADYAITQTYQWHSYFPGHAQQAEFTFVNFQLQTNITKRVGYYSSATTGSFSTGLDGFFLESSGSAVSFNVYKGGTQSASVAQSSWDDPLDGTGASGVTINWTNFNVFQIEFLYLGGAAIKLFYIKDGAKYLVHQYFHQNLFATTVIDNPSKPIRAEIRQSGAGSGTFDFICAQVSTLGQSFDFAGLPLAKNTGTSTISAGTSGTEYALLGIRKTANYRNVELFIREISIASAGGNSDLYHWRLSIDPTLSGALTYNTTGISTTGYEAAVATDQTITANTGFTIATGSGAARSGLSLAPSKALRVGTAIDGTLQQLVLSVTPLANNQNIAASINGVLI